MENIKITSINDIAKILDYVHDRIFQLSDIAFNKEQGTLSIPITIVTDASTDEKRYLFVKTWKNSVVESKLVIRHITDYTLKDDAQIGEANINTITGENGSVVIVCSVPVEIRVAVTDLEIELQISNNVIQKKSRFSFS